MNKIFHDSVADCPVCLDLNREYLRRQWRSVGGLFGAESEHSLTLKRLSESLSSTGCAGCALIFSAADRIKEEFGVGFRNVVVEFLDSEQRSGLSITLTMLHPIHTQPGDWERAHDNSDLKIVASTGPSEDNPNREWEYKISSPKYEVFLPFVATESDCNLEERDWGLPTRVLDLGNRVSPLTSDTRLYVTHREPEAYVCLSHRWGSDGGLRPLEATVETLSEFEQGISYQTLPKTFQDAVVFTRKLGYRFLWIDSLCIVQDDNEDWLREAGHMASIYENADLTLAAASSSDSKGGLFCKTISESLVEGKEHEEQHPALRRFSDPSFFEYDHRQSVVEKSGPEVSSPLIKRAWIYQERILSRRMLYFTPLELVFECRDANSSESGYQWIDSSCKHAFTPVYGANISRELVPSLWRKVVSDFTQLELTLNKDTLPAIAGVATRFSKQLKGKKPIGYLAGAWRETFIQDMLWEAKPHRAGYSSRIDAGIPSWSWARSDLPKTYQDTNYLHALCRLEDAVCTPVDSTGNVFTGVSSGYAVLSGHLLPATMRSAGIVVDQNPRVHHYPDRDYAWFDEGPDKVNVGDELFVHPLMVSQTDHDLRIHALVLRRCSSNSDAFIRIGIFGTPISVHHLQNHHYIFEGSGVCLEMYKRLVTYGETLLGPDGLYRAPEKAIPLWFQPESESLQSSFHTQANYLHLCLYGPKAEFKFKEFFGQMHLDELRSAMRAEMERVEEWRRREAGGEVQVYPRCLIKIV
ncbi:HET domain protein [Aspergillus campestris IBT 28561]|uniref:HET domain protein n=1 Tax=Aspergillus campestris (strain IBT 28561) TaxID=1392248 RepID=A0A2I1D5L4_ASPC2|nr:HET domain protein [Aspergillus campestris IBT 28561]PKY05166.1 HET domain protein [Aspergillus campestris IBT 28561]